MGIFLAGPNGTNDGYTATATIEAVAGLYPECKIEYRPALYAQREEWKAKATAGGEKKYKADFQLLENYLETINGDKIDKKRLPLLKPALIDKILDQILGYSGEEEVGDLKN